MAHADRLSVALDATPLLGRMTGIGQFCRGALAALGADESVDVAAFAVSWRRRHRMVPLLPSGVRAVARPMPARPVHLAWRHLPVPPIEWWTGPVDVVHGTNFVVPPARTAARVVTVHDLTAIRFPELCEATSLMFPALVTRAVERGAWVHTPSRFVAEEVVTILDLPGERVRAIHHGLFPSPAVPAAIKDAEVATRSTASSVLPSGIGPYILSLGTVEPRKDLPLLVSAFEEVSARHPGVWLVIAGPDGWGSDALDEAIERIHPGARSKILRTGYVSDGDRGPLISGATVFAYPSLYEGFGFPPLEAMASDVPVVATRAGSVPEIVDDAALLVDPGDREGLARELLRAVEDDEVRNSLSVRGRARVAGFTWERWAVEMTGLYRDARDAQG